MTIDYYDYHDYCYLYFQYYYYYYCGSDPWPLGGKAKLLPAKLRPALPPQAVEGRMKVYGGLGFRVSGFGIPSGFRG